MNNFKKIKTMDNFITEKIDVHQNALLGDYDKAGNYYISRNIIDELFQMKKIKKSTYNNSMFCVSNNLGIGELVFEIHYNKKIINGIASCEMFLLENVYKVNGYYSNTLRTKIGEYEESVKGFIDKSYKYFNITLQDEEEGRDEKVDFNDLPFPYILAKKQYENAVFKNIEGNIYDAYEEYFTEKLEKLTEANSSFANAVVEEYNNDFKSIKDRFMTADKDNNAKAKSELLDKAVENKIDAPETQKEDVNKYTKETDKSTEKLAKVYNEAIENNEKRVRKQMLRNEYEKVEEIKSELAEHDSKIKKEDIPKENLVVEEVVPQKPIEKEVSKNTEQQKPKQKEMPKEPAKKEIVASEKSPSSKEKNVKVVEEKKKEPNDIISQLKADIMKDKEEARKLREENKKLREEIKKPEIQTPPAINTVEVKDVEEKEDVEENTYPSISQEAADFMLDAAIGVAEKVFGGDIKGIAESTVSTMGNVVEKMASSALENVQVSKDSRANKLGNTFVDMANMALENVKEERNM